MLEGNVQNVFFSEKLSRKDPGDLQDARPGATLGDFLGEVATFEADEAWGKFRVSDFGFRTSEQRF